MDYSCHGIYIGIHKVAVRFHCSVNRFILGQVPKKQTFGDSMVSVKSIEKVTSTQEQVQKYSNRRKEASLRL